MPSEAQTSSAFQLCERCLPAYRALRFDETARLECNIVPYATIMWLAGSPHSGPTLK